MSALGTSNLNLNLNLNLGAGNPAPAGAPAGVRINTQEFRKLVDRTKFPFVPGSAAGEAETIRPIKFREFWDPELQAYVYLNHFVRGHGDWLEQLVLALDPLRVTLGREIDHQLTLVVDAAPERESRFAEIIQQDSAEGALSYWFGMFMLQPATAPATCLLVRVARRIGEMAAMCLKDYYRFPRPSQLCPAIVPMIDPPATSAFPSGHALQSTLISLCLHDVRGALPQAGQLLVDLADRVAENREIAGLHYPLDSEAGKTAAAACHGLLQNVAAFQELRDLAKQELLARKDTALRALPRWQERQ